MKNLNSNRQRLMAVAGTVLFAAGCFSVPVLAEEATGVLKRASSTMGDPKSVKYVAEGNGYTLGQAFIPGVAWPRINVHNQTRTINYDTASMREEVTLSRAEPKGGGGYPLSGQQKSDGLISGTYAWNMAGTTPQPGPRYVAERSHELWITPHGVLKAAARNDAKLAWTGSGKKTLAAVSFTQPGALSATAYINDQYLVERVESRFPNAVLGETTAVTSYSEYRAYGGIQFPGRIEQSIGGHPVLSVIVTQVEPNAAADITVPDAVRTATERVTTDKVADGVWFVAGASHNSVVIEMKDHLVVVESPLGDFRAAPVFEAVKKLVPGKAIRYVINSHNHFDHSGGLRAAVAEGATIVTQAGNKAYFEKAFATRGKINPDLLTKSGKKAKIETVGEKKVMTDGTRSIELHRIKENLHNDTFLMVYLPKEKLLIEADAYTPPPPNVAPAGAPNNAHTINLVKNVERLKLSVERIVPLHSRVATVAEMYTAAGASMPK